MLYITTGLILIMGPSLYMMILHNGSEEEMLRSLPNNWRRWANVSAMVQVGILMILYGFMRLLT
jgi:hypothetical protein